MLSATEEHARGRKLGLLSLETHESSQPVTLEVRQDSLTVQMRDVSLVITGDAFARFMEKLMLLPSQLERGFPLKVQLSIPRLLPVENAQSSSSMRGLAELSITTHTAIRVELISSLKQE